MQIDGFWSGGSAYLQHGMDEGVGGEEESIDEADLFGEHLDDDLWVRPLIPLKTIHLPTICESWQMNSTSRHRWCR